jgi:hypothetical protein
MTKRNVKYGKAKAQMATRAPDASPVSMVSRDGTSVTLQVKSLHLPTPERALTANRVRVVDGGRDVEFVFGQGAPGRTTVSAALVASVSKVHVRQALYSGPRDFVGDLHKMVPAGAAADEFEVPDRTAYERASIISWFASDEEGEIRFYRVTAGDLFNLQVNGPAPNVQPVVAVYLPIERLAALAFQLESFLTKE